MLRKVTFNAEAEEGLTVAVVDCDRLDVFLGELRAEFTEVHHDVEVMSVLLEFIQLSHRGSAGLTVDSQRRLVTGGVLHHHTDSRWLSVEDVHEKLGRNVESGALR